jgi:protein-S-isoprenylcysteine O-methyltransferase Ste14
MKRSRQNLLWILPLVALVVTVARPRFSLGSERLDDLVDAVGLVLVLLGVALRVCARGWKYENGRQGLVTDGLYGYVRHPLYAASFLIGIGICTIIGAPAFALAYLVFFWASHLPVIRHEEAKLARRWSAVYAEYQQRVPALIPALGRLRERAPIRPRTLAQSIRREADAVCGWTLASAGLIVWQDLRASDTRHAFSLEVQVLLLISLLIAVTWLCLRSGRLLGSQRPTGRPAV